MTPNGVTAISAGFSLTGILLVGALPRSVPLGILVALLLAVGYAFDSADGQLARLRGSGAPSGEWLDHVVDCAKITALHLAVLLGVHRTFGDSAVSLLPMLFLLVANMLFFTFVLTDQLKRNQGGRGATKDEPASTLRSIVVIPTDYGLLCVVFVLWGLPNAFVAVYGLLLLGSLGYLVLGLPKWFRDVDLSPDAA
ncbi:CDP-alcohol phosphatidyltransferase family protein [Terrabacter sp. Ter38]|uniref:CDP-alcohol phosphatidyltransferase family protein n=1 Tax=Terrabacter sp. Ter38 TaxID=2926030 RepID=UPI00211797D0|nr:CDP-alcohol phosphatidyltransferase family protein [Terrabacter sp. Ter38]